MFVFLENAELFPLPEHWWLYAVFILFVVVMLAIDLGIFHRKAHAMTVKQAAIWSAVWVGIGLTFNIGLQVYADFRQNHGHGPLFEIEPLTLQFLTAYVLEYALSVDNIFVFILVFTYFGIPPEYRHRVLFYGILGAIIFRGIFIALGTALLQIHWIVYVFGIFLIATGIRSFIQIGGDDKDPSGNWVIKLMTRFVPVSNQLDGDKFFTVQNGIRVATPLFVALVVLETSDIVFAIDSVPAVLGVSNEPFIVFTSNILAILGLRSMYFLLAAVIERFHLLQIGLSVVLTFIGVKMVILDNIWKAAYDVDRFPIGYSLLVIVGSLLTSVVASLIFKKKEEINPA